MSLAPLSTTSSPFPMPFRFLDLPTELRLQVYEHVVVVGRVFYDPDPLEAHDSISPFAYFQEYEVPSLAILRVRKQIHAEAEDIYLKVNLFGTERLCTKCM
jgi:hypothetical protein